MPIGRLCAYNAEKGYGFIAHGNNEQDMFVHANELAKAGVELSSEISLLGLVLEYDVGFGKNNKKQALNIKIVTNSAVSA